MTNHCRGTEPLHPRVSFFSVSLANSGFDAKGLLQGLMTNDMSLLDMNVDGSTHSQPSISTAFLTSKVGRPAKTLPPQ